MALKFEDYKADVANGWNTGTQQERKSTLKNPAFEVFEIYTPSIIGKKVDEFSSLTFEQLPDDVQFRMVRAVAEADGLIVDRK